MGVASGVNSMISANSTVEISYLSPCQVGRGFFRKESIKICSEEKKAGRGGYVACGASAVSSLNSKRGLSGIAWESKNLPHLGM